MFNPGTTKRLPPVTTRVWIGGAATWAFVAGVVTAAPLAVAVIAVVVSLGEKAPLTNVTSSEEREVLAVDPDAVVPVNVIDGTMVF